MLTFLSDSCFRKDVCIPLSTVDSSNINSSERKWLSIKPSPCAVCGSEVRCGSFTPHPHLPPLTPSHPPPTLTTPPTHPEQNYTIATRQFLVTHAPCPASSPRHGACPPRTPSQRARASSMTELTHGTHLASPTNQGVSCAIALALECDVLKGKADTGQCIASSTVWIRRLKRLHPCRLYLMMMMGTLKWEKKRREREKSSVASWSASYLGLGRRCRVMRRVKEGRKINRKWWLDLEQRRHWMTLITFSLRREMAPFW
jgi:hypothetical protein